MILESLVQETIDFLSSKEKDQSPSTVQSLLIQREESTPTIEELPADQPIE